MNIRKSGLFAVASALMLLAGASIGQQNAPNYSNKWRIEVSEGANSDGTILFRVTPKDGTATDVAVAIKKGRGENNVAHDIRDVMKSTLNPKEFHAEVDDGEDVLVKKRTGPDFALVLVESSVKGVRIHIEKE